MITGNEPFCPITYSESDNVSPGVSIRAQFANSAPDNIPDWFVHVPPPAISIKRPLLPKDSPEEHFKAIRDWREIDAELPDELKWFDKAWDRYLNAVNKWEYENKKERYFQWRTFYAENLIAELNKPTTNE